MRRTIAAIALAGIVCASCTAGRSSGDAALSAGRDSSDRAAVASDAAPAVASTVSVAATVPEPTTAPARTAAAPTQPPSGPRAYLPVGTPTTTIVRRTAPPGVTTHGYGDQGWEKSVSSGATAARMGIYPADIYLDQALQVFARASFTGGYRATEVDYGDGTVVNGPDYWNGLGCTYPATRHDDQGLVGDEHVYDRPGTYTVTVTFTFSDCSPSAWIHVAPPPPGSPLLPSGPPPTLVPLDFGKDFSISVSLPVLGVGRQGPAPHRSPAGPIGRQFLRGRRHRPAVQASTPSATIAETPYDSS